MNKFISSVLVLLVLVVGGLYLRKPEIIVQPAPVSVVSQDLNAGAAPGPNHLTPEYFTQLGIYGALSTSSSSPAAYGNSSSFQMVVPAAATSGSASTTAVTSLSNRVYVQQRTSTGIAGTTCNTSTIATGTTVSLTASTTNTSLNGVKITVPAAPVTNPYCFDVTLFR